MVPVFCNGQGNAATQRAGEQMTADNEQLSRARDVSQAISSRVDPIFITSGDNPPVAGTGPMVTEWLIVIPRDCRCPMFNGRTGIGIVKWKEELQVCMRAHHLSARDQAYQQKGETLSAMCPSQKTKLNCAIESKLRHGGGKRTQGHSPQ